MPETQGGKNPRALIVFAKIPAPNKVKTRLTTVLTPQEAADLYDAFLKDAIDLYLTLPVDLRLYFSPSDEAIPPALQPANATMHLQKGEGLGARMAAAFAETFVAGYEQVVIIGTDHPTLPAAFIEQSFALMEESGAITLGPSDDGGYYALGMNAFYPRLFQDMTYSHDRVFRETLERAHDSGASLHILPAWYDVDDPETLGRLLGDLDESDLPLIRTRKMLLQLEATYPVLRRTVG